MNRPGVCGIIDETCDEATLSTCERANTSMDKPNEAKHYLLVNITEELVRRKVKSLMAEADMCRCEKCYCDVCALILNTMTPQYVTTEKGKLLSLLNASNNQFHTDLVVHAWQAIEKVKKAPKH